MEELKNILLQHAGRYPLMQPRDAVKLLYQNEFGGGHLIRDEAACLSYLRLEYAAVEKDPSQPLYEAIGNGMVRVNLAAVKEEALEPLGQTFLRSAAGWEGNLQSFRQKLDVLAQLVREGAFSFSPEEFSDYLSQYEQLGYPVVSHSDAYRSAYRPAYRVIRLQEK